jgi:hypothetical protein
MTCDGKRVEASIGKATVAIAGSRAEEAGKNLASAGRLAKERRRQARRIGL